MNCSISFPTSIESACWQNSGSPMSSISTTFFFAYPSDMVGFPSCSAQITLW